MAIVIINPGTEPNAQATEENAIAIMHRMAADLDIVEDRFARVPARDGRGWFSFSLLSSARKELQIDIPGDDPDVTCSSTPFESRRLYVDGSSWLYKYALSSAARFLEEEGEL